MCSSDLRGYLGLSGSGLPRASGSGFGLLPNPQKPAIVRFRVPAQPGSAAKPNNCSVREAAQPPSCPENEQLFGLSGPSRPGSCRDCVQLFGLYLTAGDAQEARAPAARDSGHNCSVTQLKTQAPRSSSNLPGSTLNNCSLS